MEGNIIQHPNAARSLLAKFQERVVQTSALKSAVEVKRNDTRAEDKTFFPWDELYYTRIWKETTFSINQTQVAEYFPLQPTLRHVLSTLGSLFGIVYERVKGDFWHEDVQLYAIWDNEELGGAFSGYVFLDLYKRLGKYDGCELLP
jgi:metallopeptidase MepB